MQLKPLWCPWSVRNWPSLADEESAFVDRLSKGRGKGRAVERDDYTLLMISLRSGLTFNELITLVPYVDTKTLHRAYMRLEGTRALTEEAWSAIAASPDEETFLRNETQASVLLPLVIHRIKGSIAACGYQTLPMVVEQAASKIALQESQSRQIEESLASVKSLPALAVEKGIMLYNPYTPGVWGDPYYLPTRVGTLSPVRIRAILGESIM